MKSHSPMGDQAEQPVPTSAAGRPRWMTRPAVAGGCLFVVTVAVFWPALACDFINFDDPDYVTENPRVLAGLTWDNVRWAVTTMHSSNWHPLTWLSHMLDVQCFGLNAPAHHGVNVLLHAANAVLVFGLLRRMTGAVWRSAIVAALFALHPQHVESVAWISERKDLLSTFFGLLSLMCYARYAQARVRSAECGMRNYWFALFLLACGLMSKPMLVTWPVVMLLLDYWPLGRFSIGDTESLRVLAPRRSFRFANPGSLQSRSLWSVVRGLVWEKLPFLALSALSCVVTYRAQIRGGAGEALEDLSVGDRLANALVAYALYLKNTFWPADLALLYPHPGRWPWTVVVAAVLLLLLVSGMVFKRRHSRRYLVVGWLWFLATLLPVIGLVQVGEQSMADRYSYVPLLGVFLAVVWGVGDLLNRWRASKSWVLLATALVLGALAWRTVAQLQYWRNSETLFRHSLAVTRNNHVAHTQLGSHLLATGRTEEAIQHYRAAIRILPKADALVNLGTALNQLGRRAEAMACYETVIRNQPRNATARVNFGNLLADLGRTDEAIAQYREALRHAPDHAKAHGDLAWSLSLQHQDTEAIEHYTVALRLAPRDASAHYGLGLVLSRNGRMSEALEHYREAIAIQPHYPEARNNLAVALTFNGRLDEAVTQYREALRQKPDYVEAHFNLGCVLARLGRRPEAVQHLNEVLRLAPGHALATEQLRQLQGDL